MQMKVNDNLFDLIGIGIGPFNLSLAALLKPLEQKKIKFFDDKKKFNWHPELMLDDAPMQTSYLKDLVTPVQPTNPLTYINYLVEKGQFYHFLNTGRDVITRYEFNDYLRWCTHNLSDVLNFDSKIKEIRFEKSKFKIIKENETFFSKNICIASGPKPFVPDCAKKKIGNDVFHAKSKVLQNLSLTGKKVLVVGGGQTGLEVFRNILHEKWGRSEHATLITGRKNFLPLDEAPFTNEIFTPKFVSQFYHLDQNTKDDFTENLLLASDGNTPSYLAEFYNELYLDKFYKKQFSPYRISPMRWLEDIEDRQNSQCAIIRNKLNQQIEELQVDIIILATGFTSALPSYLEPLRSLISFDGQGRLNICHDYKLKTSLEKNHIYMMNYSRHGHGVADPQTSLMSWRSAVIANDLCGKEIFKNVNNKSSFLDYFNEENL